MSATQVTQTEPQSRMPGNSHARFAGRRRKTIAGDRVTADGRRPYDDVVGPKSRWNPDPAAVRHGHEAGRARWAAAALRFSAPGPGTSTASQRCRLRPMSPSPIATRPPERCWSQTLASVSRRQYRRTREPVGEAIETWASSTSKTAMSRRLVEGISCSGFRPRSTRSDSSAFAAVAFSVLLPKSPVHTVICVGRGGRSTTHACWNSPRGALTRSSMPTPAQNDAGDADRDPARTQGQSAPLRVVLSLGIVAQVVRACESRASDRSFPDAQCA